MKLAVDLYLFFSSFSFWDLFICIFFTLSACCLGLHYDVAFTVSSPCTVVDTRCSCCLCRRLLKTIAMGQVLSLLICGTAVSCQYLANAGVETPMLQSFLNYALLLLFYTTILSTRKGQDIWTSKAGDK